MFRGGDNFTPLSLTDLAIWLDASDASTITLDGSNNVSEWRDKSGNARHASQSTVLNRPSYTTNGINGLPAVVGDGSNDVMTWSHFTSGTTHNFYLVVAFDATLNQYPQFGGFFGTGSGEVGWNSFHQDTSANPVVLGRAGTVGGTFEPTLLAANTANNIRSGNPFVFSFLRNGAVWRAKQTYGTISSATLTGQYITNVTRSNRIFSNYFASMSFRIAEVVCYTRDLTTGEEAQLSAYFSSRYGVGI